MYLSQLGLCCRYFLRHLMYQLSSSPCKQCLVCKYWMLLILYLKGSIRIFCFLYLFSSNSCINHPSPHESYHEFTNNNFAFHKSQSKYLGFHRKPAEGESECTEVCSYIKRLKSELKSSHQTLVKVVWPWINDLFSSIDLQCACSHLGFWQFTFNRVRFNHDSQNTFSVHHDSRTKWSIMVSRKQACPLAPSPHSDHGSHRFRALGSLVFFLEHSLEN